MIGWSPILANSGDDHTFNEYETFYENQKQSHESLEQRSCESGMYSPK